MPNCKQVTSSSSLREVQWATQNCTLAFNTAGNKINSTITLTVVKLMNQCKLPQTMTLTFCDHKYSQRLKWLIILKKI